jgi:hypothetical protein
MKKEPSFLPPPHYTGLRLRNFRGFRNVREIPLAPLTFLVGPNSSGKSSLFDALLLATQSGFAPGHPEAAKPSWGGPLVDLGSYKDAVFSHNTRLPIEIALDVKIPLDYLGWRAASRQKVKQWVFRIHITLRTSTDDPVGRLVSLTMTDLLSHEKLELHYGRGKIMMNFLGSKRELSRGEIRSRGHIRYLISSEAQAVIRSKGPALSGRKNASQRLVKLLESDSLWWLMIQSQRVSSGRAAPKRWYPVTDIHFDPRWGYVRPTVLDAVDPTMLDEAPRDDVSLYVGRARRPYLGPSLASVLKQLEIATAIHASKLSPYHTAIQVRDSVTGITSNIIDVGYGLSQAIPILHACLGPVVGPLFVEQPEIHLHPRAQGVVAEVLCNTSKNRQVVVETHSVHMINRARILVARRELPAGHVLVNYVSRSRTGSRVQSIPILQNGDFGAEWPEGFFDERYEDTLRLLQLKP